MQNPDLVRLSAEKLSVSEQRIFGLAFEYNETPHSRKFLIDKYQEWAHSDKLHEDVQSFCLDVLSGRIERSEIRFESQRT